MNKGTLKSIYKECRDKNKTKVKSYRDKWRREHPNYSKEWAERNKSKIRLSQIKYNYNLTVIQLLAYWEIAKKSY